jgi:UDPglucose--hexose-1-phosphate uridylyltransferase
MGRLRRDETTEEWVLIAPARAQRMRQEIRTERPTPARFDGDCPFCPGNEDRTPPEISRWPAGTDAWRSRLIPNMYPALSRDGSSAPGSEDDLEMEGVGSHEVVIESELHDERIDAASLDHLADLLRLWRDRSRELAAEPWARAVSVFRNFGAGAGTSIEHPHSQIIATSVTPPELRRRMDAAERYWDAHGRSVYADVFDRELDGGERIVALRDDFAAWAPFASRFPFETWILPRDRAASFSSLRDGQLPGLAALLHDVLVALREGAGDPDYNLAIRSAPVGEEGRRSFVWHLAVFPRLTIPAGFELGSGMAINPMPPERASEKLRATLAVLAAG